MPSPTFPAEQARRALLAWYDANARSLPWRSPPGAPPPAPWPTLVSEIMLQQTTVATVSRRFVEFLDLFPTPAAMANAPEETVLSAWSGLGYYARARRLRDAAAELARMATFPRTASAWRRLPGVGDYTAAAVASICFGEPALALDANLARVLARWSGEEGPLEAKGVREGLHAFGREALDAKRPGDFNQAMMDLGSTICLPGPSPRCAACPVAAFCAARRAGKESAIPAPKIPRAATEKRFRADLAFALLRDGAAGAEVFLWRRPDAKPYAGLWELPTWRLGATDLRDYPREADAPAKALAWLATELRLGADDLRVAALAGESTRHAITIYKVALGLIEGRLAASAIPGDWRAATRGAETPLRLASGVGEGRWTGVAEAAEVAQATPQRKLLAALAKRLAGG